MTQDTMGGGGVRSIDDSRGGCERDCYDLRPNLLMRFDDIGIWLRYNLYNENMSKDGYDTVDGICRRMDMFNK